jgi:hypothetical protein
MTTLTVQNSGNKYSEFEHGTTLKHLAQVENKRGRYNLGATALRVVE